MRADAEETAQYRGDWKAWMSLLCDETLSNVEEFYSCVEKLVWNRDHIIFGVMDFTFETQLMHNVTANWADFIESLWHGRCQTLRHFGKVVEGLNLKLLLNATFPFPYKIYIHDPGFFTISVNPSQTPLIAETLRFDNQPIPYLQSIAAEEHILVNREEDPCEDYDATRSSFSTCVAEHVASTCGCKVSIYYIKIKAK